MESHKNSAEVIVRFDGVYCDFKHRSGRTVNALVDVSVDVWPGELICILGRSGHGKSTFLRVLAGLQSASRGTVHASGRVVKSPGNDRPMVFQQDTVFPWMHVRANVEFALRAKGIPKRQRKEVSRRWLEAVGLTPFAESWPRELSGGMRKRVALASVLASDADVWLMDEPFGSLDYFTRRGLHDLLIELWLDSRKTVFFVTHDIEESLILADRILVMSHGRLVEDIPVTLTRPRTEEVRASADGVAITRRILQRLSHDVEEQPEPPTLS